MGDSPLAHAKAVITSVRQQSAEVVLFYSGGKDSLVLLDLIAPVFDKVHIVFMYFVPGLEHIDKYLAFAQKRYPNVEVLQVPHWILTYIHREGHYCNKSKVKLMKLKHVAKSVCQSLSVEWSLYGMRQADSMHRRLMLRTYDNEAICHASQKAYPLSKWSKGDVLAYIRMNRLPRSINYGSKKNSSGLTFDPLVFSWLRDHYPADLEKIYQHYPLSRQILFEYDHQEAQERRSGIEKDQVPKV